MTVTKAELREQISGEWKIGRRQPKCGGCGRAFASGEEHTSGLVEAVPTFERRDFCDACWSEKKPALYCNWRTRAPERITKPFENVNALVEFFRRLSAEPLERPEHRKILFITSLLLMRKRRLRRVGQAVRPGGPVLIVEKMWDGETVEVPDPPIEDAELEALQREMERMFQGEEVPSPKVQGQTETAPPPAPGTPA